jgi:hypothetical protein
MRPPGHVGNENITKARFFRAKQPKAIFVPIPQSSEEVEIFRPIIEVRDKPLADCRAKAVMGNVSCARSEWRDSNLLAVRFIVLRLFAKFITDGDEQVLNCCRVFSSIFEVNNYRQRIISGLDGPILKARVVGDNKRPFTLNERPSLEGGDNSESERENEHTERKSSHPIWMSKGATTESAMRGSILSFSCLVGFTSLVILFGCHQFPHHRRQFVGIIEGDHIQRSRTTVSPAAQRLSLAFLIGAVGRGGNREHRVQIPNLF